MDYQHHQPGAHAEAYRLAIIASERLRAVLQLHGLELGGLRGVYPSASGEPMVETGKTSATVVHALASLLEKVPPAPPAASEVAP
ncbi:hypothetical protein ACFV1W_30340 [Kitasatospora sp. NPDC059648]|uniref:hypothetical protein n=1 Tax=Kitasatospora sp. NPDC059648 TaxID=3346894 RepID=UPI0036991332